MRSLMEKMTTNRRRELARRGTCPDCGDEYKRLAIHWKGPCSPPPLQSARLNLITGFLLGGGRIGGNGVNKHFQVTTQWRPFAFWVFEQLDWLGATVVRKNPPRSDDTDTRPPAQHYKVRTHAHPALNRFRAWYPSPYDDEAEQSGTETENDHEAESSETKYRTIPAPEGLPAGRLTQRLAEHGTQSPDGFHGGTLSMRPLGRRGFPRKMRLVLRKSCDC